MLLEHAGDVNKKKQEGEQKQRELEFATWLMAWDGYCVGAAIAGQMRYPSALVHKQIVMKIACRAKSEKKSMILAVLYDRLVRFASVPSVGHLVCLLFGRIVQATLGERERHAWRIFQH